MWYLGPLSIRFSQLLGSIWVNSLDLIIWKTLRLKVALHWKGALLLLAGGPALYRGIKGWTSNSAKRQKTGEKRKSENNIPSAAPTKKQKVSDALPTQANTTRYAPV